MSTHTQQVEGKGTRLFAISGSLVNDMAAEYSEDTFDVAYSLDVDAPHETEDVFVNESVARFQTDKAWTREALQLLLDAWDGPTTYGKKHARAVARPSTDEIAGF
jgi:hypothetical protein